MIVFSGLVFDGNVSGSGAANDLFSAESTWEEVGQADKIYVQASGTTPSANVKLWVTGRSV